MEILEFSKLTKSVIPLLLIKDDHQLMRFELILGYPQMIIEEPNMRNRFPIFGYKKLPDSGSKWIDYKCAFSLNQNCSIIKKLLILKCNDRLCCEIFLILLEACLSDMDLLKYIIILPSEDPNSNE